MVGPNLAHSRISLYRIFFVPDDTQTCFPPAAISPCPPAAAAPHLLRRITRRLFLRTAGFLTRGRGCSSHAPTGRHANPTLVGGSDEEAASTDRCGQEPSAAEAQNLGVFHVQVCLGPFRHR